VEYDLLSRRNSSGSGAGSCLSQTTSGGGRRRRSRNSASNGGVDLGDAGRPPLPAKREGLTGCTKHDLMIHFQDAFSITSFEPPEWFLEREKWIIMQKEHQRVKSWARRSPDPHSKRQRLGSDWHSNDERGSIEDTGKCMTRESDRMDVYEDPPQPAGAVAGRERAPTTPQILPLTHEVLNAFNAIDNGTDAKPPVAGSRAPVSGSARDLGMREDGGPVFDAPPPSPPIEQDDDILVPHDAQSACGGGDGQPSPFLLSRHSVPRSDGLAGMLNSHSPPLSDGARGRMQCNHGDNKEEDGNEEESESIDEEITEPFVFQGSTHGDMVKHIKSLLKLVDKAQRGEIRLHQESSFADLVVTPVTPPQQEQGNNANDEQENPGGHGAMDIADQSDDAMDID